MNREENQWYAALRRDVSGYSEALSDNDRMWAGDEAAYVSVGQSAVRCARLALALGQRPPEGVRRVLDFPCGHGRALRFLQAEFPDAAFTGGDLDTDAVDFCAEAFGATPVYSDPDLSKVAFAERFDLIWCGSLLTHLDAPRWTELLALFERILEDRGLAIVTVHGPGIRANIRAGWNYWLTPAQLQQLWSDCKRTGFGYQRYPKRDVEYGISMSQPAWVLEQVAKLPTLQVVGYTERGWDNHQDVLVVQKATPIATPGPFPERHAGLDLD